MIKDNLNNIVKSIDFYQSKGFKMIDLEWTVPEYISDITKPIERKNFYFKEDVLVASGEQTFIKLMLDGKLQPNQNYMGLTPCFRDEEKIDETHQMYFMKLELFSYEIKNSINRSIFDMRPDMKFIKYANENFCNLGVNIDIEDKNEEVVFDVEEIESNFDIVSKIKRIELGSYGFRIYDNFKWYYGTGIAEPRFTYAKNKEYK